MIKGFQRQRFSKRSEQLDPEQMQLLIEDLEQPIGAGVAAGEARADAEAKNGQLCNNKPVHRQRNLRQQPASVPCFDVVIDLDTETCPCCQGKLQCVGESRGEMLDLVPAQLRVKMIRQPRHTCKACDTPITQAPARPINGSTATALIAHVLISNPTQLQRLLAQLQASLPVPARATRELKAILKTRNISNAVSAAAITAVSYAGDKGGIICRLEIPTNENNVHVSITHLRFDPRLPFARYVTVYKKHGEQHVGRRAP